MKKLIIGIIAGASMLIINMLISALISAYFPDIQIEYENEVLFRPWTDPLMSYIYFEPFIVAFILLWFWEKTKGILPEKEWWVKGIFFGLLYWLLGLPGLIMSYSSFPISLFMTCSWAISGLFQSITVGIIYSKSFK
jgi:hypothetical protein